MHSSARRLLIGAILLLLMAPVTPFAKDSTMTNALTGKQQSIVVFSAFAANGDLNSLAPALNDGLDAGLTVNEIRELLVQVYAYAGFPRSLNALGTFKTVLDQRTANGIADIVGPEPTPPPRDRSSLEIGTENQTKLTGRTVGGGLFDFAPVIDTFLKAHLFGDIFQRDIPDWQTRELATIAMLTGLDGVDPQLQAHLAIGMHNGLTADQIRTAAFILGHHLGQSYQDKLIRLLDHQTGG